MNPLIYAAIGVGLAAIAVTVYAVLYAQDGYEDEEGFHGIEPDTRQPASAERDLGHDDPAVHSYASRPLGR
jgi:hypothetical protein